MVRTIAWLSVFLAAPGCVLYSKDNGRCEEDDTGVGFVDPEPSPEPTEPAAEEPAPFSLALSPSTGEAGSTLLTSLVVAAGSFDLSQVAEVTFAGSSLVVLDQTLRAEELLLVVDIPADSVPGPVEAFVLSTTGEAWLLDQPFEVTAAGASCPTDPTGSATSPDDTGCP